MKKESFEEFLLSKGYDKYSKVENKFIKNSIDCDFSIKYYFPNNFSPASILIFKSFSFGGIGQA